MAVAVAVALALALALALAFDRDLDPPAPFPQAERRCLSGEWRAAPLDAVEDIASSDAP